MLTVLWKITVSEEWRQQHSRWKTLSLLSTTAKTSTTQQRYLCPTHQVSREFTQLYTYRGMYRDTEAAELREQGGCSCKPSPPAMAAEPRSPREPVIIAEEAAHTTLTSQQQRCPQSPVAWDPIPPAAEASTILSPGHPPAAVEPANLTILAEAPGATPLPRRPRPPPGAESARGGDPECKRRAHHLRAPGGNTSNTGRNKAPMTPEAQGAIRRAWSNNKSSGVWKMQTLKCNRRQRGEEKPKPCAIAPPTGKQKKRLNFIFLFFSFFSFFLAVALGLPDLRSPTRDWTGAMEVKAPSANHWTARELPETPQFLTC